ncbi:threonine synthase [Alkalibacter saccharofermentans]|uniref:Threonine synthase n=1 Tax=Alkalibacter saccharofermentans DSM 14828 TaxID=1120975 RepID=A0A1M4YX06_9FIRM|nr:threonine synthase [Alkalibacter saccharofermentans]SHF10087.1 threonine synthase [Alkalibacter saccharofermentans DSM 14828]
MLKYNSTRSNITAMPSEAILKGISSDGGLFVPEDFPKIEVESLNGKSYEEICFQVLSRYFHEFDQGDLKDMISQSYGKFNTKEVTPLAAFGDLNFLELYHGPTLAFKDVALSILPHLLTASAKIQDVDDEIVILTATSGDTGKAALEGFANVKGTSIVVFFPNDGVSMIQRKQMTTQSGENVHVIAIEGNFDDAQRGVKEIFSDEDYNKLLKKNGFVLSSANSINIGRLVPQIVYYFDSYIKSVESGKIKMNDPVNFTVPTGNFGNILAGYYAKNMGLPINKLICASNDNNVLFDFFKTGEYDKNRPFIKTISPSMDILVSSNFERLLYHVSNFDSDFVKKAMDDLSSLGKYKVSDEIKNTISENFYGNYCDEKDTLKTIKNVYDKYGYVIDPHTAVGCKVYEDYKLETGDNTYNIILSTASPYKFTKSVYEAIFGPSELDDYTLIEKLSESTGLSLPNELIAMCTSEDLHKKVCDSHKMKESITEILL